MVLIDRKCNEEQLLHETAFEKIHIERDIREKQIFEFIPGGYNLHKEKAPGGGSGGFNTLFGTSFSNIFRTQTFAGTFCLFFLILISFA